MEKGLVTQLSPNQTKQNSNENSPNLNSRTMIPNNSENKIRNLFDRFPLLGPSLVFSIIIISIILISAFAVHGRVNTSHAKWSTIFLFFKMHYFISAGLIVTMLGVCASLFLIVVITFDNYDHFFCSGLSEKHAIADSSTNHMSPDKKVSSPLYPMLLILY